MTRTVIFAFYDKSAIIHDYVLNYLRHLKEVADKIIFIADNHTLKTEQDKLQGLVEYAEFNKHGEYDFGSYKRGFQYAQNSGILKHTDELIFANDSCFCIDSLLPIFEKMAQSNCDFWGITESKALVHHLQSYFLVFKNPVFTSSAFADFINSITKQVSVKDVIKNYELKLTSVLEENGFKPDAFIKASNDCDPMLRTFDLFDMGDVLIKRKIFTEKDACINSPRVILNQIKNKHLQAYNDICHYYKKTFSALFPLIMPADIEKIKHFLFQKKITNSGKLYIKICKLPVYRKELKHEN